MASVHPSRPAWRSTSHESVCPGECAELRAWDGRCLGAAPVRLKSGATALGTASATSSSKESIGVDALELIAHMGYFLATMLTALGDFAQAAVMETLHTDAN